MRRTLAIEELHQQVGKVPVGQLFGGHIAYEGVGFGGWALVLLVKGGLDVLCAGVWDDLGDALRVGELLGQLHDKPCYGDAARGAEELGLVAVLHAHRGGAAHHVFGIGLYVVALEVGQLALEVADLVLQVDDVVAGDLAALGGVKVLAVGIGALAGPAAGEPGVASCLALDGFSVRGAIRV